MTLNETSLFFGRRFMIGRRFMRKPWKTRNKRNKRNTRNFSGVFLSAISAFSEAFSPRRSIRTMSLPITCFLVFSGAARAHDVRKSMVGVYRQDTSGETTWRAKMDVVDKKGTVLSKKFALR